LIILRTDRYVVDSPFRSFPFPLSPRLYSTPHPLVSSSLGHWHWHWHWHCSLYGTCLPLLPAPLTSPSPHLSPFFPFEQPTIYNLNLTCNYQYHLYITSTLSPLVSTCTTPQSTSFILSHPSISSRPSVLTTYDSLSASTTLQTSAVIRLILPTHHSLPSSPTHISSPSPTTG
jgi:hypothetical protein